MCNKKDLSLRMAFFLMVSLGNLFSLSLFYTMESDSGDLWWTQWEINSSSESLTMIQSDRDGIRTFRCDINGSVREMTFVNPTDQLIFHGRIQNDTLVVSGENHRTREISMREDYWYQPMGPSFFDFVLSDEAEREFFIVNPDNLKSVPMKIRKKGNLFIEAGGVMNKAIKAELRLSGILAPFWSGTYWFSSETGILLKYAGDSGPGTPYMTMKLVSSQEEIDSIKGENS